VLTSVPFTLLY